MRIGIHLRRFCLALHAHAQVTTQRLTSILNGIGMEVSKLQVVRILTTGLDGFFAKGREILRTGLTTARYVSVDDACEQHAHRDGITSRSAARGSAASTPAGRSRG
ncbi:hypothetical protein [Paracoccus ravus]|uniref:hypothetical protein n=1 Tax=Paracoccus ravus TaxID=2447760 RepID=UPI00106ED9BE|nr:hypothetical protein [Paracoccus ravus]